MVVLLVAADRVALLIAERQVAAKVQSSQQLTSRPSVSIEGFPFLTQVISNRYHAVRLGAKDLTVGTGSDRVQISTLTARLTEVRATDHFSGVTARTVTGTATVSYAELSRVIGVKLGYAGPSADGNGRVQASSSVSVQGTTITGTASAEVGVTGSQLLTFSAVKVSLADTGVSVPQSVTDQLGSVFGKQLALSGLPFGLRVQRLVAGPSGVQVTATARDVSLG